MKSRLLIVAGLLGCLVIASDAFAANMWRTNHGNDGGGSGSGASFVGGGNTETPSTEVSVAEPSALYALASGLALLGTAGWVLRRK